ncbi:hypothetical protein KJS94_16860 [Flavihumibacter rivuli]|uniref:hypothetical protein n=1 Tax=Flavihumibacter rivuli TaxID=2838156 RepID=UPI001BDF6793|nr:hypothetical protein [Flavihumibacter rivuli]ULQ56322.1 hypothetical protein KJS94_16860 [Flavihumibacter rivuli]
MQLNPTIRKLLGIALLFLATLPIIAALLLPIRKWIVEHEWKERLELGSMVTVELRKGSYTWVRPGKEIRIGNRMFDVKETRTSGNLVYFKGIYDDQEAAIEAAIRQNNEGKASGKAPVIVFWSPLCHLHFPSYHLSANSIDISLTYALYPPSHYRSHQGEPASPPPNQMA